MSGNLPPSLQVQANGTAVISDAYLNGLMQCGSLVANLRAFVGISNMCVMLTGDTAFDDGEAGFFGWSPTSTAPDDGLNIIRPNGLVQGAWVRLTQAFGSLLVNGTQALSVLPTGNELPTLSSLSVQGNAISNTTREYLVNLGMTTGVASGGLPNGGDVTLYAGMVVQAGATAGWAYNTVTTIDPGAGSVDAYGYELDYNNNNADTGDTPGAAGLSAPVGYGLAITGAGAFRSTGALTISGLGTHPIWNRGIVITNGSVAQASFQDLGVSTLSLDIQGTHTYGIDTISMVAPSGTTIPLRIGNEQAIASRNAGNTADLNLVRLDSSNNFFAGEGAAGVFLGSNTAPLTDNLYSCGDSANRWTFVWAVNGTIQTSDPRAKTNIRPAPAVRSALLHTAAPIMHGWRDAPDGGRFTGDDLWGFDAAAIKAAFAEAGVPFGGVVPDDKGMLHLSPMQMLAVLWRIVMEQDDEIAALKARAA
jgi:hypothetical protein